MSEPVSLPVPHPLRVVPLLAVAGSLGGHRLVFLSAEVWPDWWDLRFARVAEDPDAPIPRRHPPGPAWSVADDAGVTYEVVDAWGRGDRDRSIGEVRLIPSLSPDATRLAVRVKLLPDADPLTCVVDLPAEEP